MKETEWDSQLASQIDRYQEISWHDKLEKFSNDTFSVNVVNRDRFGYDLYLRNLVLIKDGQLKRK